MANAFQIDQAAPMAGLGTFTCTVVTAGMYTLSCRSTIPCDPGSSLDSSASDPAQSNVQIVLKQNNTTLVTVGGHDYNPTPSQGTMAATASTYCAAGDVMKVIISSSNAIDAQPNSVKSIINLYAGK